jgi:hypothetical protein
MQPSLEIPERIPASKTILSLPPTGAIKGLSILKLRISNEYILQDEVALFQKQVLFCVMTKPHTLDCDFGIILSEKSAPLGCYTEKEFKAHLPPQRCCSLSSFNKLFLSC